MEKAKESLEASKEEAEIVSSLSFTPHRLGVDVTSFYRYFSLRGIRVDRYRPGFISCTFKVPPRLTDKNGNLGSGAIATLVDEVGCATVYVEGLPFNVTVDISINYVSTAKLDYNSFPHQYSAVSETNVPAELYPQFTTIQYTFPHNPNINPNSAAGPPPVYLFVLDTCMLKEEQGFVKSALKRAIGMLPENALVGFISFGAQVLVQGLGFSDMSKVYVFRESKKLLW